MRGDEIAKSEMRSIALLLLSQHVEDGSFLHNNAIAIVGSAWENTDDSIGSQLLVIDDVLEHSLRVVEEFLSLRTGFRIVEDLRVVTVGVLSANLPCAEEWEPVNIRKENVEVEVLNDNNTRLFRWCGCELLPLDFVLLLSSLSNTLERSCGSSFLIIECHLFVLLIDFGEVRTNSFLIA